MTEQTRKQRYRADQTKKGAVSIGLTLRPSEPTELWNRLVFEKGGPKAAFLYLLSLAEGQTEPTDEILITMLAARLGRAGRSEPKATKKAKD